MEDDGFAGSIPESGAIFMSNTLTKKECFKRKIFGLPSSQADFVKQIKAGMILFLFEFKKRQLFGVYQASSDGAIDIVPNAFNYSGKRFPAQVCFTPLWYCDPLSEKQFREAIIENYVSSKKFKFGLSEIQVRRLLDLFNSRKIKKEIIPRPMAEAVGAAGMDRSSVRGARFELSHRGYSEPTEIDVYNPAAFSDYHANSLVKEDEVFTDDRVNNDGKTYALVQGDFEARRRRFDNIDMLLADDMAKAYNNDIQTKRIDSPRDSLDEVRHLAAVRQLLAAEKKRKDNQVNKIRNAVRSSEYLMGPLDVRDTDDDVDIFMQRNRFFDEYNRDGGFTSKGYGNPFDRSKDVINDGKFLFDDYVHRNQNIRNIAEHMAYSDDNLSLSRQAMQVLEDRQYLKNKTEENKVRFDSDVSPFSATEHNAGLLPDIRETHSVGRFLVNDRINAEPNFGSSSVENSSLTNFSRPLHLDHRIIHGINYPIVERRVPENTVASSARNAGYFESVGGQVADNGMFRKSEGIDNEKDFHRRIGPSSFSEERNSSSLSARFLPEKRPQIFGLPQAKFDDATIMRPTPYKPEHPKISHEFNVSTAANQNPTLVLENPHREDFYQYTNRSSSYILEPKKSSGSPDIAPEHCNEVLATNVSGHQGCLRGEGTSSYLNSGVSVHMDRNITVPVNDRDSLFSKSVLAQPAPDREYTEGKFAHHFQSSGNHFSFDANFPTESRVLRQEMDILAGKDFICSEAKYSGSGAYHLGKDVAGFGNQCIGASSKNVNCQANHERSEAPHFDSNVNKKSVFSRLASRKESQGGEERDVSGFDCHDHYMDATPDEVMEMLRQSNNSSPKKKSRAVGQPNHKSRAIKQSNHGESTFGEKHVQSHIENKISMEKKASKDAILVVEGSIDELPKETRIKDFKRRSYRNKNLAQPSTDPSKHNKITGAAAEVKKSMKTTLKRKRLVRPVFGKTESATDVICGSQNSQPLVQIPDNNVNQDGEKSVSICEVDMTKENTILRDELVLSSHQSVDRNKKEQLSPEKQKNIKAHVLRSSNDEIKEDETAIAGIHIDSSQDLARIHNPSIGSNMKEQLSPEKQKNIKAHVLPSSNDEIKEDQTAIVGTHIDSSQDLVRIHSPSMGSNMKEHLSPEEQKSTKAHVMPFSSDEHKEHKTAIVGIHVDSSQDLMEIHSLSMGSNIKEQSSPEEEQTNTKAHVMPVSSDEHKEDKTAFVGIHVDSPQDLVGIHSPYMDINIKEQSSPEEEQKNTKVQVMSFSSDELKEHKSSIVDMHVDSPQDLVGIHNQSMDVNMKEQSILEVQQKNTKVHVMPSSSNELKEHKSSIVGITVDGSQALTEIHGPSMGITLDSSQALLTEINSPFMGITLDSSEALLTEIDSPSMGITLDSSQALSTEIHSPSVDITLDSSQALLTENDRPSMGITVDNSQALSTEIHSPSMGVTLDTSQALLTEIDSPTMGITVDNSQALSTEIHSPSIGVTLDTSQTLLTEIPSPCMDYNTKKHLIPEEQKDIVVHAFPSLSNYPNDPNTPIDGPQALPMKVHEQSMDCNIKEPLSPEEQKDTDVHDFPSSTNEPIEHKTSIHIDSSQALLTEIAPQKGVDIQTCVEEILNTSIDSTAGNLNMELEIGDSCLHKTVGEKRREVVKRKREFIKRHKAGI